MKPEDFRRLVAAGLSSEQIALVMEMMEREALLRDEAELARKAKGRERVARWREKRYGNVTVPLPNITETLTRERDTRVEDNSLTQKIEPQENKEERNARRRASSVPSGSFGEFWALYPHKVGKPVAEAKFAIALRIASFETIMDGLRRYVAKTDDRPWCNPSTWLHQQRWTDQPATVVPMARGRPPPGNAAVASADRLLAELRAANGTDRTETPIHPQLAYRVSG